MKNLITAIASLLLLLAFVTQFFANQITHNNLARIEKEVCLFNDIAKHEGYISTENKNNLASAISGILDCSSSKIKINGTTSIQYRGDIISYNIKFPLENLIASKVFWGFNSNEDTKIITLKRATVSEVLDRRM